MFDFLCIFCKIIQGSVKSPLIKETEHTIVIKDIAPKAPIHYLIIPKKHIQSISALSDSDAVYALDLINTARDLGNQLPSKAFNLIVNNGDLAGQKVFHLHLHFLSGRNLCEGLLDL